MCAIGHHDIGVDRLELGRELADQRREGHIEEQHPVLGVVDDVDDLLGEEPRVDGVHDRPGARHAEVQRQVAIAVPRECRDPVSCWIPRPASALATCLD